MLCSRFGNSSHKVDQVSVACWAVCVLRSCGSVCLHAYVCGSMQYWPFCGIFSCLCVEELWDCALMCLWEYKGWAGLWRDVLSVSLGVAGVCLCDCSSMQYWPVCGVWSCLWVEELWECVLMCLWEYAVLAGPWRDELSVSWGVVGVCAYVSLGVCSIGRYVAGWAICELRSCGTVCLCVSGSMQYWPICSGMSYLLVEELPECAYVSVGIHSIGLSVEELWECMLMCLWEYAVLAFGLSVSGWPVCVLRSCGGVGLCVCGSMQYWPVCGE